MHKVKMTEEENKAYKWMKEKAQPEIAKFRWQVIIGSAIFSLVFLGVMIWYWINTGYKTSLLAGGLFLSIYGTLLLALTALSRPDTLALMSMTRLNGNWNLFAELMKARFLATTGILFIFVGFSLQLSAI